MKITVKSYRDRKKDDHSPPGALLMLWVLHFVGNLCQGSAILTSEMKKASLKETNYFV